MRKKVLCLLLGLSILSFPAQEVLAAPLTPVAKEAQTNKLGEEKPAGKNKLGGEEKPAGKNKLGGEEKPAEKNKLGGEEKPAGKNKLGEGKDLEEKGEPKVEDALKEKLPVEKESSEPTENKDAALPEQEKSQKDVKTKLGSIVASVQAYRGAKEEASKMQNEVSELRQDVVKYALQFVGNPYVYGGTSLTNGADCSGFVQSVYAHFDYSLPRTSKDQAKNAGYMDVEMKESELLPGDLIFYADGNGVVFHVALYIGEGEVVHAANSRKGIIVSEYTHMNPYKARRVIE